MIVLAGKKKLPLAGEPSSSVSEYDREQANLCLRVVTCWQPPGSGCGKCHRSGRAG